MVSQRMVGRALSGAVLFGAVLLVMPAMLACGPGLQGGQAQRSVGEVKRRFAYEFRCPPARVTTTPIDRTRRFVTTMGAQGCGHRAVYVYSANTDTWVLNSNHEGIAEGSTTPTTPTPTASTTPTTSTTSSDSAAESSREPNVVLQRDGAEVRGVRVRLRSDDVQLDFLHLPSQDATNATVRVASLTSEVLSGCHELVLQNSGSRIAARIEGGQAAVDLAELLRLVSSSQPLQAAFCGRAWAGTIADSHALHRLREATPAARPRTRSVPGPRHDAIREHLTNSAAVIHACTGSDAPVGISAEWNARGHVSYRVRSSDDHDVNQCVQVGLGQIDLPRGGSGQLIHAVP